MMWWGKIAENEIIVMMGNFDKFARLPVCGMISGGRSSRVQDVCLFRSTLVRTAAASLPDVFKEKK